MANEPKTLKQIESAQAVLDDVFRIIEGYSRVSHDDIEGRFRHAVGIIARQRLIEIRSTLSEAWSRAYGSNENLALVDKSAFDDIRWFRSIGPAQLSKLARVN